MLQPITFPPSFLITLYYNTNNVQEIPPNIWWQWRNELMMIGADGADVVFDVRYDGSQLMVT